MLQDPKTEKSTVSLPKLNFDLQKIKDVVGEKFSRVSSETLGWLAVLVLHSATIPSFLAVMAGLTDKMPGIDLVMLIWTGLTLLFIKAAVQKDMLNIITIGVGFIIQAAMMALIFFK
jgi:hypothetical protein